MSGYLDLDIRYESSTLSYDQTCRHCCPDWDSCWSPWTRTWPRSSPLPVVEIFIIFIAGVSSLNALKKQLGHPTTQCVFAISSLVLYGIWIGGFYARKGPIIGALIGDELWDCWRSNSSTSRWTKSGRTWTPGSGELCLTAGPGATESVGHTTVDVTPVSAGPAGTPAGAVWLGVEEQAAQTSGMLLLLIIFQP